MYCKTFRAAFEEIVLCKGKMRFSLCINLKQGTGLYTTAVVQIRISDSLVAVIYSQCVSEFATTLGWKEQ